MCVGIPLKLIAVEGIIGEAMDGTEKVKIDLSLVQEARPGDWVLNFLGAAREILSEDEALKISAALKGLAAIMNGNSPGEAFADLDNRTPTLPPHLQAAFEAGQSKG